MDDASQGSALIYPFDEKPEPGCVVELADGVYWIRMPLPFRLNHINLYLLRDGDGWTVVDTGIGGHDTREHWETLFRDVMDDRPIKKIIVTHLHPDHIGQAGWLTRHSQAQVWMSRTEFFMCKMLCSDGPADVPDDAIRFYHRAGFTAEQLERYKQGYGQFGTMVEPLPAGYRRIDDGERITIDESQWEVVIGRGHSPAHACLYSLDHKVLLSGDQVLPRISSNVSVFPTEPAADPLHEWLSSCVALRARLPDDVLVCPAHNEPFTGLHARLSALIAGHADALGKLHTLCKERRRAVDVFPALFKAEITDEIMMLATGESLAHLNYLLGVGALSETLNADGVRWFEAVGDFDEDKMPELAA